MLSTQSRKNILSQRNVLSTIILLLCIGSLTAAYETPASSRSGDTVVLARIGHDAQIHIDHRSPPPRPGSLHRRQDSGIGMSIGSPSSTESISPAESTTASSSVASSSTSSTASAKSSTPSSTLSATSAVYTSTSLPQPFDTSLGNNFTSTSCPTYFTSFLNNSTFMSCLPISLLLQNSLSFFQAVRAPRVLNETLDTSCSASLAICSPLMSSIAANLITDSNCGDDFSKQNPVVTQAYAGLMAYEPMYKASCLTDNSTGNYCFAEALTNSSDPSASYPYYIAVGIGLPSSASPGCTACLQKTMEIFAGYARMKNQPLSRTYLGAAQQIDQTCGPSFANTNVQVAVQATTNTAHSWAAPTTNLLLLFFGAILASVL